MLIQRATGQFILLIGSILQELAAAEMKSLILRTGGRSGRGKCLCCRENYGEINLFMFLPGSLTSDCRRCATFLTADRSVLKVVACRSKKA